MLKENFKRQTTKDVRSLISLITFWAEVEIRGVASPRPVGPDLQIFGLITLPLVINYA